MGVGWMEMPTRDQDVAPQHQRQQHAGNGHLDVADQGRRLGDPLQACLKAPRALNQPAFADLVEPCDTCGAGLRVGIVVWVMRVC